MTKEEALNTIDIYNRLKGAISSSYSINEIANMLNLDKNKVMNCIGYLLRKKTLSFNHITDNISYLKDLDEESIQELRQIGEVQFKQPEI